MTMMISNLAVAEGTALMAIGGGFGIAAYFYVAVLGQICFEAFGEPVTLGPPEPLVLGGTLARARVRRLEEWALKNQFDVQVTAWTETAGSVSHPRWIDAEFDTGVLTCIPAEDFWIESDEHRRWGAAA